MTRPAPLLRTPLAPAVSLVVDVATVIVFVLIGRRNHEHGFALPGLLFALLPWLVGLAAGWGLIRWRSGNWPSLPTHGVTLAVVTVVLTLILRPIVGQSVGQGVGGVLSFGAVALGFLLLGLVGWRLVAASVTPGRGASSIRRS